VDVGKKVGHLVCLDVLAVNKKGQNLTLAQKEFMMYLYKSQDI
jgi:hypothetical protein